MLQSSPFWDFYLFVCPFFGVLIYMQLALTTFCLLIKSIFRKSAQQIYCSVNNFQLAFDQLSLSLIFLLFSRRYLYDQLLSSITSDSSAVGKKTFAHNHTLPLLPEVMAGSLSKLGAPSQYYKLSPGYMNRRAKHCTNDVFFFLQGIEGA